MEKYQSSNWCLSQLLIPALHSSAPAKKWSNFRKIQFVSEKFDCDSAAASFLMFVLDPGLTEVEFGGVDNIELLIKFRVCQVR